MKFERPMLVDLSPKLIDLSSKRALGSAICASGSAASECGTGALASIGCCPGTSGDAACNEQCTSGHIAVD